jgi:hypothetical protein
MLSLTIFDVVRSARPLRAPIASVRRSPTVTHALVANDTAQDKIVSRA